MKINQDVRVGIDKIRKDTMQNNIQSAKFGQMITKQDQRMQTEALTKLLGDITTAGDRLARSRNLRDMAKFKMLIKKFLEEAVDFGMGLKQSHTWNRFGEGRKLKIVETIDEKLVELAEEILSQEKSSIELLDKIGEIKGLLINLYT
ncbi:MULTISPECIES: YaaR family protein [unclassified Psychrobacillus]|uniref:YaaR family protein n=1 Tax=unclassified Psychrobacillus TaxID=2636677 RepID=UPI00146AC278|nr:MULTISPECIES: YaaR family protein [unclassified Psychrobacillus]MCM3359968.1 YaaR family protein [Psychrobacillus sp. MER TA 171]NME06617.1 YaaR family protein [Psychrobacillus sp. BL-248-WT-3]